MKTLDELYEEAAVAKTELDSFAESLLQDGEDVKLKTTALKSKKRAKEKLDRKYEGDTSMLMDLARCTFLCETVEQIEALGKKIEKNKEVVLKKDRIQNPNPRGYRDLKYCVKMSNNHAVEIQVKLNAMERADEKSHRVYDVLRKITEKSKTTKLTPEEQYKAARANETCKYIYWYATEKYNQKTKGKKLKEFGGDVFMKKLDIGKTR